MKFIAHPYINNNGYVITSFNAASGLVVSADVPVAITDEGIVFFSLARKFSRAEKAALVENLHSKLQNRFGIGFSAATIARSDCTTDLNYREFFQDIQAVDPLIKKIQIGKSTIGKDDEDYDPQVDDTFADVIIERAFASTSGILQALQPTLTDKDKPAQGWKSFSDEMKTLYEQSVAEIRPSAP